MATLPGRPDCRVNELVELASDSFRPGEVVGIVMPMSLEAVVAYLGVTTHMEELLKGVLDLKDLVFYASFIGFGLFLAQQSIESQRWRA